MMKYIGSLKKVELEGGKYILLHNEGHGGMTVLRNGKVWRNETGDKLILAMFEEIESLKSEIERLKDLPAEKLDELQRLISIRKVEASEICHHEKLPKPNFNDLNWAIEQIYWIKKTL